MSLPEHVMCVGMGLGLLSEGERIELERTEGKLSVSEHLGDGRQKQIQLRRAPRKSQRAGMQQKGSVFTSFPSWEEGSRRVLRVIRPPQG